MKGDNIKRFAKVKSEHGIYIVSIIYRKNGEHVYGCSCPAWKFRKTGDPDGNCKHIKGLLNGNMSQGYNVEILDMDVYNSLRLLQKLA